MSCHLKTEMSGGSHEGPYSRGDSGIGPGGGEELTGYKYGI